MRCCCCQEDRLRAVDGSGIPAPNPSMNPLPDNYKWWEERVVQQSCGMHVPEPSKPHPHSHGEVEVASAGPGSTESPTLSWKSGAWTERESAAGSDSSQTQTREARWNARRRARRRAGLATASTEASCLSDYSVSTAGYYPEIRPSNLQIPASGSQTARAPRTGRPGRESLFQAQMGQLFPGMQAQQGASFAMPAPPPLLPTHQGFFQVPTNPAGI